MDASPFQLLLLIFVAIALGFALAKEPWKWVYHQFKAKQLDGKANVIPYNSNTLESLMDEQPDFAIDALIQTLSVSHDTLETHMALGKMLSQRGETQRAIRIHQNILQSKELSEESLINARLALADDYFKAGLLDRAEALYRELSRLNEKAQVQDNDVLSQATQRLVDIFQGESEWLKAIDAVDALLPALPTTQRGAWHALQAQFYCEVAHNALDDEQYGAMDLPLKKAEALDSDLLRILILKGRLAMVQDAFDLALRCFNQVCIDSAVHHQSILPLLITMHNHVFSAERLPVYLRNLYQRQPSIFLLPTMMRAIADYQSQHNALSFIVGELRRWPNLSPLSDALNLLPESSYEQLHLEDVLQVVERHVEQNHTYECQTCGYSAAEYHWRCPSCKHWGASVSNC